MKHYLDLIKISAKRHRKQNRMTRLCIVLAVFLVTVIFGMADMEMRSQYIQAIKTDGSWHAAFAMEDEQGAFSGCCAFGFPDCAKGVRPHRKRQYKGCNRSDEVDYRKPGEVLHPHCQYFCRDAAAVKAQRARPDVRVGRPHVGQRSIYRSRGWKRRAGRQQRHDSWCKQHGAYGRKQRRQGAFGAAQRAVSGLQRHGADGELRMQARDFSAWYGN